MLEKMAQSLTRFAVDSPWRVLALFVLITGLGAAAASRLQVKLNYMELLPDDAQQVVDLKWVMKKAGTEGYLVVAVSGGTRESRLALAPEMVKALEALPEIRYAEYTNETEFFRKNAASLVPLSQMVELREELDKRMKGAVEKSFDLGLDDEAGAAKFDDSDLEPSIKKYEEAIPPPYLEDKPKSELYLLAKPSITAMSVTQVSELLDKVDVAMKAVTSKSGGSYKVEYGGPAVFMRAFDSGVRKDLGVISTVSLVAAALLLLLATRRPIASLFVLIPIAIAIVCALGVAAIVVGHLNIISSLLVAILLGLGVEFGIHLILRTNEARVHLPLREALLEAVPETMEGAFSGAITNGAAFAVLVFASFSAYRQFGMIAAIGILLSWLFTYMLLPALIVVVEKPLPGWVIRANTQQVRTFIPPRWMLVCVLVGLPMVGAFGLYALPQVKLERSFNALHGDSIPDPVGMRSAIAMGTTLTPAVIWVKSIDDAKKVEAIFDKLKREDTNPNGSIIQATISLGRVVHEDWDQRQPEIDRIKKLLKRVPSDMREKHKTRIDELETALNAPRTQQKDIPATITRKFAPLDNDGTFVLYMPSRSVDDADELDDFVAKLEQAVVLAKAEGVETRVMSENRIAVTIFRQVFADAPYVAWSATLVALLVLFVLLRNVKETLIVFSPIAFGMLVLAAGLYITKTKLNFINMCVIPSIFTVAIDNTIHLYHRYSREGRSAMPAILANTGVAVLMASLVNTAGYAPMLLAGFYGLRSLGIVATFGMFGMVLATVVWFPAILLAVPERWVRKNARDAV